MSGAAGLELMSRLGAFSPASFASGARPAADARAAADGFESMFLYQLLAPLEQSSEAMFGDGAEGRTFAGLFRQVLADQLAKSRPLGIAQQIEAALARNQGPRPEGRAPAPLP